VGQKTEPYLNVDNFYFAMGSGRKACDNLYVKSLQILSRKKYKNCIAVCSKYSLSLKLRWQ